ncbi:MAG: hypothetical protein A2Y10_04930 [Planctomycetes bacterium GWF2_41_51]|nr:MAG: hypothetical protein A2Y10_04930 [Planctomycetes bacterium GWF2_41_51]HBG25592.1 hypothetical protein [Phycisphaerales bacterium]
MKYSRKNLILAALFLVPFIFYPFSVRASWVSNSDIHSLLEFFAAALALITASIILIQFFATGYLTFLFLSLGFTLQGSEDFIHAVYSFVRIWPTEQIGMINFMPGTYVAGRLVLVTFCIIGLAVAKLPPVHIENRVKYAIKCNIIGFVISALATIGIVGLPLPKLIFPGHLISRPIDLVVAIIYLVTFILFVRLYRFNDKYHTPFEFSMIASLIFGFAAQLYMVHSQQLYDAQFNMSHIAKIVSYIFPIFGISAGIFGMYRKQEHLNACLLEDVANRKKTEEKLRQEMKFHTLFDSTSDAIMLLDERGIFDCNNAALKLFGYSNKEEFCTKNPADLSPLKQPCGTDSVTMANRQNALTMEKGTNHFEWLHKRNDTGREFSADVLLNVIELDGRKVIHAVTRDITEQKQAQERINNSQKLLQRIVNLLPERIFWKDKNLRYLGCNEIFAKDAGKNSPEELVGKDDFQMGWKEQAEIYRADDQNVIESGKSKLNFEEPQTTPSGGEIWLRTSKVPLTDLHGNTIGVLGTYGDITEQKQAQEEMKNLNKKLEDANQELKHFVYIASHDLREPLRKISAFGIMLEKSLNGKLDEADTENLNFMIDGANRMTQMIEGLLAYSRVSTKTQPVELIDLNEMVRQIEHFELSVLLEERQASIEVPQTLPSIKGDPTQIRQLIQNLIANGIKYQKKGNKPHIEITSKPASDGMVKIAVSDNGIGIKPEYLSSIFGMFKRLHSRSEYEGTGIGLAVCKKIVERHGGQIGIESQPDVGSTFWFTIPAINKQNAISDDNLVDEAIKSTV